MSKKYHVARAVRERYGNISDMTLWRWLNSPAMGFPQPVYFGRLRLWDDAALESYDAEQEQRSRTSGGDEAA